MNVAIKRVLIGAVTIGVVASAYAATRGKGDTKKDEVTYETGVAAIGSVRSSVSATGVVEPWKTVDVKSNVDGRIVRLYVDLGDPVRKDQVLMDIDPTNTKAALDQAKADLDAAHARKAQAQSNLAQQRQDVTVRITQAQQAILAAEARLAQAEAGKETQGPRSNAAVSQAEAALTSAERAVMRAEANRDTLNQQLQELVDVTIPLNTATATTNLAQAETNLAASRREYARQRNLQGLGYVSRSEVEGAYARLSSQEALVKQAAQRAKTLERENSLATKTLQARIRQAESEIKEAEARVEQARAGLEQARINRQADVPVSKLEHDAARAARAQAIAELNSAKAQRNQIAVREKELINAQSAIVSATARHSQASVNFGFTRVTAPRPGIIITKNVEQGTVVPSSRASIGSTNALLQIGDTTRLWIKCQVDETDISQVSVGQKVMVNVEAYPELKVVGRVIRIDPQAVVEQNVTNIPVTVEITQANSNFKPGMNATCEFIVNEALDVLVVPNEAVRDKEGKYSVRVMPPTGAPTEVEVEVGLQGQESTEIRSGLQPGDKVVTREIRPEREEGNNPFNPFGRFGGNRRGGARGAGGPPGGGPRGGPGGGPGGPRGGGPGGGGAPGGGRP